MLFSDCGGVYILTGQKMGVSSARPDGHGRGKEIQMPLRRDREQQSMLTTPNAENQPLEQKMRFQHTGSAAYNIQSTSTPLSGDAP
jgi:hypothetical protein